MPTDVFDKLARRLREVAREHAVAERRQPERWKVTALAPLTAANPDGDVIAAETDPDFHVSSRVRAYDADTPIVVGDILIVLPHDDDEWTAIDVEDL